MLAMARLVSVACSITLLMSGFFYVGGTLGVVALVVFFRLENN